MNSLYEDYLLYKELLLLGIEIVDKEDFDSYIEFVKKELEYVSLEMNKSIERKLEKK